MKELVEVPARARRMYPHDGFGGLDRTALQVLMAFAVCDSTPTGLKEIADTLALDLGPVSRAARRLSDAKLLEERGTGDRGARLKTITPAGERLADDFALYARRVLDERAAAHE